MGGDLNYSKWDSPKYAARSLNASLHHSYDGRLRFATNNLGSNVAQANGVSPSRNEQSRGCFHCPFLPARADSLMMAALRMKRSAS
jgi:hypothetical protein